MKKILASLVMAGLVASAFAQTDPAAAPTFTWNGYASTGVSVAGNGTDKAVVGLWDDDNWGPGGRLNLDLNIAQGNSGFKFQIRGDGANLTGNSVSGQKSVYFKTAYAYTNFFDKMLYTQAGIINEQTTRAGGDAFIRSSFTKETPGAILLVRPALDGMTVAVEAAIVSAKADGTLSDVNTQQSTVGGAFIVKDVTQVKGGLLFANTAAAGKDVNYGLGRAYVAASLDSVKNMKLWVEGWFSGLGAASTTSATTSGFLNSGKSLDVYVFSETTSYNFTDMDMAQLTVGLRMYQALYGSDVKTTSTTANDTAVNPSLSFTPWVSYALDGGIVPKLSLSYFMGPELLDGSYSQKGSNLLDNVLNVSAPSLAKSNVNNVALFEIKPSVLIKVGASQSLTLAYAYDVSAGSDDVYFKNGFGASTSKSNSVVQANYIYSF